MILDNIENLNIQMFRGIIKDALQLLNTVDFNALTVGEYSVDGDNLFYQVQEYETLELLGAESEFHKKYCDIQYVVQGEERMGWTPPDKSMCNIDVYQKDKDIAFFPPPQNELLIHLRKKDFVFFAPYEIHRPRLVVADNKKNHVKKVVIKIKAEKIE